jgi:hypothetical protein
LLAVPDQPVRSAAVQRQQQITGGTGHVYPGVVVVDIQEGVGVEQGDALAA